MTTRLVHLKPRQLLFSPYAWAKIQRFFMWAGKLEMSGFGVSKSSSLLYVEDFQTIKQVADGTNTEMDDMALNKYIGDMARKGIPPAECARIWVHSHPFTTTTMPGPSTQDKETFKDKICDGWNADWGAMVIIGGKEIYCELFVHLSKFDGYSRFQIPVATDWMGPIWDEHDEAWEKEFDEHVIEEIPEPVDLEVIDEGKGNVHSVDQDASGFFNFTQAEESGWRIEWHTRHSVLTRREWILGRAEGYSVKELMSWGRLCVFNSPHTLRKTVAKIEKQEATRAKKKGKQEKKNGKKNKNTRKSN